MTMIEKQVALESMGINVLPIHDSFGTRSDVHGLVVAAGYELVNTTGCSTCSVYSNGKYMVVDIAASGGYVDIYPITEL